ncbi:uncharacterized protein [Fopius arisanus]|uniref:Uncharacterized protein isoform X2 n=1 Tax=Fopius arisanus TaxID=64838 RepID=A0A9R1STL2_9HYME|nr:PREDICTED: uncharacterized protein LOC105262810 isoform X2 [Fopius arisanus]
MKVFIILSILGSCLAYCQGNDNSSTIEDSTKSTHHPDGILHPDKSKGPLTTHDPLLHRLIFPKRIHEDVNKSPVTLLPQDLTDVHGNKSVKNPRNVIFVMLEGAEGDDQWRKFKDNSTFFTEGVLQKCFIHVASRNISGAENVNCDWKKILGDGINDLMMWARQIKQMNIGTVSGGNFTLPSVLTLENPSIFRPKIFNENPQDTEIPLSFLDSEPKLDNYPVNYTVNNFPGNVNQSTVGIPLAVNPYSIGGEMNGEPWDFLDMIAKIRFAIFKTFLDSLHGESGGSDGVPPLSGSSDKFLRHSGGVVDIIANTLGDLQTIPSERGYLLIVVATSQELPEISELLRRKTSVNDTLLILTALENSKGGVPFLSSGPGASLISSTKLISDIPKIIKWTLESAECRQNRHQLALLRHGIPRGRVARSDDDDETLESDEMNPEEAPSEAAPETSSVRLLSFLQSPAQILVPVPWDSLGKRSAFFPS